MSDIGWGNATVTVRDLRTAPTPFVRNFQKFSTLKVDTFYAQYTDLLSKTNVHFLPLSTVSLKISHKMMNDF